LAEGEVKKREEVEGMKQGQRNMVEVEEKKQLMGER